jgi:hypothetical protein
VGTQVTVHHGFRNPNKRLLDLAIPERLANIMKELRKAGRRTGAVIIICSLLLAGCGNSKSNSSPSGLATTSIASTAGATSGSSPIAVTGKLSDAEFSWIQSVQSLLELVTRDESSGQSTEITKESAQQTSTHLRKCGAEMAKLPSVPTIRLQTVANLLKEVCTLYDREAGCYEVLGQYAGQTVTTEESRKMSEASACVSASSSEAASKMTDLMNACEQLKR